MSAGRQSTFTLLFRKLYDDTAVYSGNTLRIVDFKGLPQFGYQTYGWRRIVTASTPQGEFTRSEIAGDGEEVEVTIHGKFANQTTSKNFSLKLPDTKQCSFFKEIKELSPLVRAAICSESNKDFEADLLKMRALHKSD